MIKRTFIILLKMKKELISFLMVLPLAVSNTQAQPITAGQHTRVETVYGPIEGYRAERLYVTSGSARADTGLRTCLRLVIDQGSVLLISYRFR